jgi:hypothetical protein
MQRKIPFIEIHEGKAFVTKPIDCQSEILLLLLNFPKGVDRREIGSVLGRNYSPGRITQALQELEVLRQILKVDEKYLISGPRRRTNKQGFERTILEPCAFLSDY